MNEFAPPPYFYSPKAYRYMTSINPSPNPLLIRKWSPLHQMWTSRFFQKHSHLLKIKFAVHLSKRIAGWSPMLYQSESKLFGIGRKNNMYTGFVDYGNNIPGISNTAFEALVVLLVVTRSHWKCPIGYFLVDKVSAKIQAKLIEMSLPMVADAGLKVWSVLLNGTSGKPENCLPTWLSIRHNMWLDGYKI